MRSTKGAVKVYIGLGHDSLAPSFVTVSDGKTHDMTMGRTLDLPADSIVVMDRAYTDYTWFNASDDKGIFFKTRQKHNASYRVIERRAVLKTKGLTCDQAILLTGIKARAGPTPLRLLAIGIPRLESTMCF